MNPFARACGPRAAARPFSVLSRRPYRTPIGRKPPSLDRDDGAGAASGLPGKISQRGRESTAGSRSRASGSKDDRFDAFRSLANSSFSAVVDALRKKKGEQAGYGLRDGLEHKDKDGAEAGAASGEGGVGKAKGRSLTSEAAIFRMMMHRAVDLASRGVTDKTANPLFWSLRHAFVSGDVRGLRDELRYAFQTFLLRAQFSPDVLAVQRRVADLRHPFEWYPATRAIRRTIHLHVGPTNSGKTYQALKALESAGSGIYAGPLRLLAHEIYGRLTAKGKACALVTGEEQRIPAADRYYVSCTVEMTPLNRLVDVAVIDEIQMMGDPARGFAWTAALLGVQAREVHLCGEERAVELVQSLCGSMGDRCVVHRYERLSPVQTMTEPIGRDLTKLQKGDAIVTFSRLSIHALKMAVEQQTGRRCAIVYGSLPPETRAQQAALFNDPDNDYDFIAASDAIGMGLNLEIKRVVFESVAKWDGGGIRDLTVPEVKQIGGRAGRYRTARQAMSEGDGTQDAEGKDGRAKADEEDRMGLVTCLEAEDLPVVQQAFVADPPQMTKCYVQPPAFLTEQFAACFPPGTPLRFILLRMRDLGRVSPRFDVGFSQELYNNAEIAQEFAMPFADRLAFLNAPTSTREPKMAEAARAMARCISEGRGGGLTEIREIDLELLDEDREAARAKPTVYLHRLEVLHKAVTLYLWLSYRFMGVFPSRPLAFHVRGMVEERINQFLEKANFTMEGVSRSRVRRRAMAEERHRREVELGVLDAEDAAAAGTDAVAEASSDTARAEGPEGEPIVGGDDELGMLEPVGSGVRGGTADGEGPALQEEQGHA